MAYKVEIVEAEDKFFIKIPEAIVQSLGIDAGSELKIEERSTRSFLVTMDIRNKNTTRCPICLGLKAENECQLCRELVCSSCYWATGKLCKDCMGKK